MRDTIHLSAWRNERLQAAGVPIDLDDGQPPVVVAPLDLWPDDRRDEQTLLAAILGGADARDRWIAAGGNVPTLVRIVLGTDTEGESEDSSASSGTIATPSSPTSPASTD